MIPKRPFLLRAFYEWIVENDMTPYILVNANSADVHVPKQHIKEGKIVLNVSPMAVQDFVMDNEALSFSARFSGVSFYIYCPMPSIEAVYARESPTDGISFASDEYPDADAAVEQKQTPAPVATLSAVDTGQADAADPASDESDEAAEQDTNVEEISPRKRPSLRVVK